MSGQTLKVGVAKHSHPAYVTFYFDDPVIITDGTNEHPRWTPTEERNLDSLTLAGSYVFKAIANFSSRATKSGLPKIIEVWTGGTNFVRVTVRNPLHRDEIIADLGPVISEVLNLNVELVALEGYVP